MRKLLFVSPLTLSRSKAFELFLGNLHSLLLVPTLFDDTMRVIFSNGPYIWRNFDGQSLTQIVQSYMELLTSETDFLNTFAKAEPSAEWLMPWLHDNQLRVLATPRLAELIVEILEKTEKNVSLYLITQR
uniref:PD-(D/E)XK nuclease family protein n=1 Tax=Meloidogyne hapla TaxID=6305 RepID=A0A1I8BRA6_MELHA